MDTSALPPTQLAPQPTAPLGGTTVMSRSALSSPRHGVPRSIAHVGTFPPTQCGLATFGAALVAAMSAVSPSTRVGVIDVVDQRRRSDARVGVELVNGSAASVRDAVSFANQHDGVVVEHEFGIYGGPDGDQLLDVLDGVASPVLTVLHTVLADPTPRQRAIIEQVAIASDALIVMSGAANVRLLGAYAVDPATVHVVPHGAHPNTPRLGERRPGQRPTVLTWGLLGPGKGIEAGIDAMAALRDIIPLPRYVVAGETHPKVLASSGERYRDSLRHRTIARGVDDIVEFDASYRDVTSLNQLVRSADVVLLPYETREQVTSGVLIEAVASERPVVATDFPHARELLAGGAGIVVPHDDADAIARAVRLSLCDARLAASMRSAARRAAADALWPAVARRYLDIAAQCALHRNEVARAGQVA